MGAGGFTTRMLLPLLPKQGVLRKAIVSGSGMSAAHAAKKFGFERTSCDLSEILAEDRIDAVFITTPHHLHARMVCEALEARKHVFVEKPLAMTVAELDDVERTIERHPQPTKTSISSERIWYSWFSSCCTMPSGNLRSNGPLSS